MKLLNPINITLTTTNVSETDYSQWAVGTTYALGDRVIVLSEHNVYESLAGSNTGNTPSTTPDKWALVGKTNAYKCIDDKTSTQTINNTSIVMTFQTLKSTSIAFLNVECVSIKVEVLDGATVIFEEERSGLSRDTIGWYSYFFNDFTFQNFFLFQHLYNPTAIYRITLTGDVCKLGVMVIGSIFEIGDTISNSSLGFVDYSKKDIDIWGETYLKQGVYRDYFRGEIGINKGKLEIVKKVLRDRRGKLSLFIPSTVYDLTIYGYAQEPELIWSEFDKCICSFDIQGVS